jgi:hypothetical protein
MNTATQKPVERLVELAAQLDKNPAANQSHWFIEAIADWLNGDAPSLDAALGLTADGPGKRTALTKWRRQQRNKWICAAADCVEGAGSWQKSVNLAPEIKTFEAIIWPKWKTKKEPPNDASQLRRALFYARQYGGRLPGTAQGIDDVIFSSER